MKENRSLCQVEQLPCACLLDCHRQTHIRSATGPPIRHRANGAVGALCNSPNCVVAAKLEDSEQGWRGAGRVLVTGGAGYFGFRLGRALADQGATVLLLDLHKPPWDIPDGAVFQQVKWNWRALGWGMVGCWGAAGQRTVTEADGCQVQSTQGDAGQRPRVSAQAFMTLRWRARVSQRNLQEEPWKWIWNCHVKQTWTKPCCS